MPPDSALNIPHSPVAALGTLTLICAFLVAAYALAAGIVGQKQARPRLVSSSLYAAWGFTLLMTLASALIVYGFVSHDYRIKYVAHYSDSTMPLFYKLTAYWGGLDGSLMFWVFMLSLFSGVALYVNRNRHRDMIGYVIATIMGVALFFLALLLYSKNPFTTFLTTPPTEGQGLNPLLQTYWMAIHPPSLYTGYVGMTIPFAFAIGALASGRLDDSWLHSIRVWVIIPWFFLGLGLTLGGLWAYEELGWGGFWAWDPVENAGLFPWFTGTAFLHSVMMQERRGMMKVWNVILLIITFFLTIFGTFMTRSGIVQSVHAFGQDNELALLFLLFICVMVVISVGLLLYRLPALRSTISFDSFVSREFSFLLNNWLLLIAAFFVLFLTMFPTLSEYIVGERITIGPSVFSRYMVLIGILLLFLAGAAPLLAWRRTTVNRLFEQFLVPSAAASLTVGLLALLWKPSRELQPFLSERPILPVALICFGLIAFSIASVLQEFARGAWWRHKQTGTDVFTALIGIVVSKRRKYGGYVVHVGIALMFIGFVGKYYSTEKAVTLDQPGKTFKSGPYEVKYDDLLFNSTDYKDMVTAKVTVNRGKKKIATLYPARWMYKTGNRETTTEVAIHRGMSHDVYLVLNGYEAQKKIANFTLYVNPLVNWVWLGFGMLAFGTAICLLPESLMTAVKPRRRGAAITAAQMTILAAILGGVCFGLVRMARADEPVLPPPAAPGIPAAEPAPPPGEPAAGHTQAAAPEGAAVSHGGKSAHVEIPGAQETRENVPAVVKKLWNDLVCLCGGCNRESLHECRCAIAAEEREWVLAQLAGRDLSTPEAQKKAYADVVAASMARHGGQHVLRVPPNKGFNRLAWIIPLSAMAGGVVLVVFMTMRFVRRGAVAPTVAQAATPAGAQAPANATRDEDYEDKLDDELRDVD
jgi:cytochrome c-type biogenesis protein CcmF